MFSSLDLYHKLDALVFGMEDRLSGASLSMGACRSCRRLWWEPRLVEVAGCRMLRWEPRPVGVAELTRSVGVADGAEDCEGWSLAALFSPYSLDLCRAVV